MRTYNSRNFSCRKTLHTQIFTTSNHDSLIFTNAHYFVYYFVISYVTIVLLEPFKFLKNLQEFESKSSVL